MTGNFVIRLIYQHYSLYVICPNERNSSTTYALNDLDQKPPNKWMHGNYIYGFSKRLDVN